MNRILTCLVVAAVAAFSPSLVSSQEPADHKAWYANVDTEGADVLIVGLSHNGQPRSEHMIPDGEYATLRFKPGGPVIGIRASIIGTRGDSAELDIFEMDGLLAHQAREGQFIERLHLEKGERTVQLSDQVIRLTGPENVIGLRLVAAKFATR
ncbi:MAG: hypothetical protein AAF604_11015 [Acidobacteriota bacterium]